MDTILTGKEIQKKYKGFQLHVPEINIPKGFATALIGENGAGKTTLLNCMAGIRLDYTGDFTYFEGKTDIEDEGVRERIGYTGPGDFFLPHWNLKQVKELTGLLFDQFDGDKFDQICDALNLPSDQKLSVKKLSDGNRMKLMLATVFARNTDLLILDEPASPLDPLMRDRLCEMIRQYLNVGEGERSVFFSTHNISDMENVTDYAIIMDKGQIIEQGFVEELKEKYVMIKGEAEDYEKLSPYLVSSSKSNFGFEGLILSEALDKAAGVSVVCETPTLSQISVGIMKKHSALKSLMNGVM